MHHALLQAGFDDTGVYVAVAVLAIFALLGVYFMVRSKIDQVRGVYEQEATYVLGRGEHPELLDTTGGEVVPIETHRFGRDGLQELVRQVENRNDMGVEFLILEDGNTVPYVTAKGSLSKVEAVILSDSKGEVTVEADGRVTARPPLDPAVRKDLEKLLVEVVEPEPEVT